jgi:transketolase
MADKGRTLAMSEKDAEAGPVIDAPFGKALVQVAHARADVVGLTADLGKYTDIDPFRQAFPGRFFNVGMAEQNLIAVAAGLAKTGRVAFATTYGVFATRRAYDFIAIACAHSQANVKIIAGLPGLTTGYGGTHQAIEDLALMIRVPGLVVIDPCDATEIMQATHAIAEHSGPVYMRLQRASVPVVLDPARYQFRIGKAALLRDGADVGIISTGLMTARALAAAQHLATSGINASVLHVATWKPFDTAAVVGLARRVPALLSVENHVSGGGLASLVAEAVFDARLVRPLERVGLPDQFIECGSVSFLQSKYGLTPEHIVEAARRALTREK